MTRAAVSSSQVELLTAGRTQICFQITNIWYFITNVTGFSTYFDSNIYINSFVRYVEFEDISDTVPSELVDLFEPLPGFRMDISSSEIRAREAAEAVEGGEVR